MPNQHENDAAIHHIEQWMRDGRLAEAEELCREIVGRTPNEGRAWQHLGLILFVRGVVDEAVAALQQAVAANPENAEAWNNLSAGFFQVGKLDESRQSAEEALRRGNRTAAPWVNLGHVAGAKKEWETAADAYRKAVAIDATNPRAWSNLATCEQELGRWNEAEAGYREALRFGPGDIQARANYGWFLTSRGRAVEAINVLEPALVDRPEAASAWTAAGHARNKVGDREGAETAYRKALLFEPKNRFARHGLAVALRMKWKLAEAEAIIRALITEEPNFAPAWVLLAGMQSANEAKVSFRRAIELEPKAETHSAMLLAMQYSADVTPDELFAAHREWEAKYARGLLPANPPVTKLRQPGQKLRLGFVSMGFCRHPVGFLGLPAIERLDQQRCEIVCYSDNLVEDEFSTRFRATASEFKVTAGVPNEDLAAMVRRDEIDVLFDLGGHTEDRMLLFARKPAPLQVTWLGYVGTTGLEAMDCLLADQFHVRPGEAATYVEKVLRMPHDYICYGPPIDAPEVGPLPALRNGYVTFGSFNNPAKLSAMALDAWAEVLKAVPGSRLLLKYGGLDQVDEQAKYRALLGARGIEAERILFAGWSKTPELLAAYGEVDLALDTMPYSGGLTTCEALWMGVPVITCPGKTFAGRHSTSHLTNAGLPQFVSVDLEGFVRLAAEWARRLSDLAELRPLLRGQLKASRLCDANGFAMAFLNLLWQEWNERAAGKGGLGTANFS